MVTVSKNQKLLVSRRKVEFFVLRNRVGFDGICPACRAERRFVAIEEAMAMTGRSMLSIFAAVESGAMHYIESNAGMLMICETSIGMGKGTAEPGAKREQSI